jgi:ketosteroid isomerase-like protein
MTAAQPTEVIRRWTERFNAGDIDGLAELYEPGAVLSAGPGEGNVVGVAAILDSWRSLVGSTMSVLASTALVVDELALTCNRVSFVLPDGTDVGAATSEVVRRGPDGAWRYVLCNPYGDAILPAGG